MGLSERDDEIERITARLAELERLLDTLRLARLRLSLFRHAARRLEEDTAARRAAFRR